MTKKELRRIFLDKRNSLTQHDIEIKSKSIMSKLMNSDFYKQSRKVFVYINMGSEVITSDFIDKAISDNKIVAVPVSEKNRNMYFARIRHQNNLQSGIFNTKVPVHSESDIILSDNETLIIAPGLAFDRKNFRLGYGGGYYDTYLSKNICMNKIGVFFDFQETDLLPSETYDVPLDFIITA